MRIFLIEVATPYLVVVLSAVIAFAAYLVKEQNRQGREIVEIRTGFRFFVQQMGKGAATILDSDNPTPEPMRKLLRKWRDGTISDSERIDLTAFLQEFVKDTTIRKSERSAAWQVLASINTLSRLPQEQKWTSLLNFKS